MKVFQIGAAGGVGRRLAQLLSERGEQVTGMFRNPAQTDTVAGSGARLVVGDLIADSVETLADKIKGHDAVVFPPGRMAPGLTRRR